MNLLGVTLAVILLIILIYRRVSLIPATLICVLILAITNRISYTDLVMKHYTVSLADFIAKYFLVFVTNALFGRIMEETGLAAVFSRMIGSIFGKKYAVYGAMLATALLSYGGISCFVIVFTVYPIFLDTFRKTDLPGKFIPACIMCSSCTFPLSMLPGGAQLNNIIPGQYIGTTPMAACAIGIVTSLICLFFLFLYFQYEFRKAKRQGEHFETTPQILARIAEFEQNTRIAPWLSALPMILIILLINAAHMDLSYAVLCSCALALFIGRKNIENPLRTINEGIRNVGGAMVTTATSVGFGGAVLSCSGATVILQAIAALPVAPVVSLSVAASFAGLLTGNGGGGCDIAMSLLSGQYLDMGVAPELLHRVTAIATAAFSCLPHNGMLITIMDTCGYTARQSYRYIFVSTVISGFVCLVAANVMGVIMYPVL